MEAHGAAKQKRSVTFFHFFRSRYPKGDVEVEADLPALDTV